MSKIFKNTIWLMALLVVVSMTGCGGSDAPALLESGGVAPGTCTVAGPAVTSSNPTDGDVNVSTSTVGYTGKLIAVNFSEEMDETTIESLAPGDEVTFTLREDGGLPVVGTVTMNTAHTTATFRTSAALDTDTEYTATITTAAANAAGTSISCRYQWSFTTAAVDGAGPAPVLLGLATPFGIATAAGMDNTGATKINGDVVLDPNQYCNTDVVGAGDDFGLCGGAPPTNNTGDLVITQIHPDTTTADAVMADLNAAYLSITPANLPGGTSLACADIGSAGGAGVGIGCNGNYTLPPGVYIAASASSIGVMGELVLDGGGDPNAVFVFQMGSTLTTATDSVITLTNGTKASNVWWQVGSSAIIGVGTEFQGNVLADTSITMNNLATSCGRMLAGAVTSSGAFTFDANTVSVPGHPFAPTGCE